MLKWAPRRNVIALTYYDTKLVPMLTTGHHTLEEVTYQRRRTRLDQVTNLPRSVQVELSKFNVVHDYNTSMDGVDVAVQLRGYYTT